MGPFVRAGPWFRRGGACPVFAAVETGSGFSHFVTSMTAPIAAGWSGVSGGPCTYWLFTAQTKADIFLDGAGVACLSRPRGNMQTQITANGNPHLSRKSTNSSSTHAVAVGPELVFQTIPFLLAISHSTCKFSNSAFLSALKRMSVIISHSSTSPFNWRAWLALCHRAPHLLDGPKNAYEMIGRLPSAHPQNSAIPATSASRGESCTVRTISKNAIIQDAGSMSIGRSSTSFCKMMTKGRRPPNRENIEETRRHCRCLNEINRRR